MDPVFSKSWRSLAERPRPSAAQSPDRGTIFLKFCGSSRFTMSNNCGKRNMLC
jgi:hypothetical protein